MDKATVYYTIDSWHNLARNGVRSHATLLKLAKLANHCKVMFLKGHLTGNEAIAAFKQHS